MSYRFESLILDVPDWPKPGVGFKDITPVLADGEALKEVVGAIAERWAGAGITHVAGIESRGFIFGAPVAYAMGVGLTLIRKPGKLPREVVSVAYELEYGTDEVQIHADSFTPGDKVLIVDDVLATGGTAAAAEKLVIEAGGELAGCAFVIELDFLHGRDKLTSGAPIQSLVHVG